jgi:hypothetical protein
MIRKGDVVRFKDEYKDDGDDAIEFVAVDDEEKGRVSVRAKLGLRIDPIQTVSVDMLQTERK